MLRPLASIALMICVASSSALLGDSTIQAPPSPALERIRVAIMQSNPRNSSIRIPVSKENLQSLTSDLTRRGYLVSSPDIRAATDVASAYMRENPDGLRAKVLRGLDHRPGFHGNVAEFAEAREQGMILTKDLRSTTWDLTEARFHPRNAQIKVYQDASKGINSVLDDLVPVAKKMSYGRALGFVPQETLDAGVASGKLRVHRIGRVTAYAPASGENITLLPLKSFATAGESTQYALRGQATLRVLSRDATAVAEKAGGRSVANASKSIPPRMSSSLLFEDEAAARGFLGRFAKPAVVGGVTTLVFDSALAWCDYEEGKINSKEFQVQLQNASYKSVAVGGAVGLVYVVCSTPQGLVVIGVAIISYQVADYAVTKIRSLSERKYMSLEDLRGIASEEFLKGLPPTMDTLSKEQMTSP